MNNSEKTALRSFLSSIADAIREARGVNGIIPANDFVSEIQNLSVDNGDTVSRLIDGTIESYTASSQLNKVRTKIFSECEDLVSINIGDIDGEIETQAFINCKNLETVEIDSCKGVGDEAFKGCESLETLNMGVITGEIGKNAFNGLETVEHFSIDPSSNITKLSQGAFAGIGYNRRGGERFFLDLRNSTFEKFYGFNQDSGSSNSGGFTSTSSTAVSLAVSNMEIRLPNTVKYIGETILYLLTNTGQEANPTLGDPYSYYSIVDPDSNPYTSGGTSGSGANNVLNGADNIDLFISSPNIYIATTSVFPSDIGSHIFVSYEYLGDYLDMPNWGALPNLYGFATYSNNTTLPTITTYGHVIEWYSDRECETQITKGNGQEIYCKYTGTRTHIKIISRGIFGGTVTITDSIGHTYNIGDLVPVNTILNIEANPEIPGTTLKYFTVNEIPYNNRRCNRNSCW